MNHFSIPIFIIICYFFRTTKFDNAAATIERTFARHAKYAESSAAASGRKHAQFGKSPTNGSNGTNATKR
jgi:hypothetical protein